MLATAANHGHRVWAIDFFGDEDLRAACAGWHRLAPRPGLRFPAPVLVATVGEIQQAAGPMRIVLGSGFERQPGLVATLREHWEVVGADASIYRRLLDMPGLFAELRQSSDCRVPETRRTAPSGAGEWLTKSDGGSGGFHVRRRVRAGASAHRRRYFQRVIAGRSVSAVCVADAADAAVEETFCHLRWRSGRRHAFAYQGAMCWPECPPLVRGAMQAAARTVVRSLGLRGVFGLDFVVSPDAGVWLVDINPRPPATLELCADAAGLLQVHLGGAAATAAAAPPALRPRRAHLVVYAGNRWQVPAAMCWPDGAADRPAAGEIVARDAPLCTLRADGDSSDAARGLLEQRFASLAATVNDGGNEILPARITIRNVGENENE